MKSRFFEFVRKLRDPKDYKLRNRIYVFLICLGISVFIWFLIALSKESNTTIDFPIVFENVPDDLLLVNKTDSILSLRVSSGGFELFTFKYLSRKEEIKIDLSQIPLSREGNYYMSVFPTNKISKEIIERMNISEEIISVNPENIFLKFEIVSGKKVKVVPVYDFSFEKQYQLSDSVKVNPDSVMVNGPINVIENIRYVETELLQLDNVSESQIVKVLLKLPENLSNINITPEEVEVEFLVDKFTESTLEIPVKYETDSIRIKTYPGVISVTYLVALKDYNRVDKDMFYASVEYNNPESRKKLDVIIPRSPSFVKITKIEPQEVEYLIIK